MGSMPVVRALAEEPQTRADGTPPLNSSHGSLRQSMLHTPAPHSPGLTCRSRKQLPFRALVSRYDTHLVWTPMMLCVHCLMLARLNC